MNHPHVEALLELLEVEDKEVCVRLGDDSVWSGASVYAMQLKARPNCMHADEQATCSHSFQCD